jgi:hypothetical protein
VFGVCKGEVVSVPKHHTVHMYGALEVKLNASITPALDGEWSVLPRKELPVPTG